MVPRQMTIMNLQRLLYTWPSAAHHVSTTTRSLYPHSTHPIGSDDTVTLLLAHRSISPNAIYPPTSQVTALHLAASLGRADIVSLLLEQEDIDDTTRDEQGRTVIDVASKECKEILQGSR